MTSVNLRKISTFIVTAAMAIGVFGGGFGFNARISAAAESEPPVTQNPVLAQTEPSGYAYMQQGSGAVFNVTLVNTSQYTAYNVVVSRSITDQFAAEVGANGGPFDLGAGESRSVPVSVMPDDEVPGGRYQLELPVTYQNDKGSHFSYSAVIYISMPDLPAWETIEPSADVNPILVIEDLNVTPGGDDNFAGNNFTISGLVRNWSDTDAAAAEIRVTDGISANAIGLPDASSRVFLGSIRAWNYTYFSFDFQSDMKLAGGIYPITFEASCTSLKGVSVKSDPVTYSVRIIENPNAQDDEEDEKKPNLNFDGVNVDTAGDVTYGKYFSIEFSISNTGDAPAENAQLTVAADSLKAGAIELPNSATSKAVGSGELPANEETQVGFTFYAGENIETGSYPITFELSADSVETKRYTYSVRIEGKPEEKSPPKEDVLAKLGGSVTQPTGIFDVSQKFDMTVSFTNTGKSAATAIKVTASEASGAVVPRSASVQQIDSIPPGQTKTLTFSFMPSANVFTQFYTIEFKCEYNAGIYQDAAVIETFSLFGGASVVNSKKDREAAEAEKDPEDSENIRSIPKIIVSNYTVTSDDPEASSIVLAGREFDLFLEFRNTHPSKKVSNIKITLTAPQTSTGEQQGNTFSVVGGSNTIFVEEVPPNGITQKTLRMYCVTSAAAKNHIISVNFEYEDEEGNQITQHEEVGVTVTQEDKLEVGDIYLPSAVMQNESVYLYFSLQNTGRVTLYNMKVSLEGEGFDLSGSEMIVGNLQSGGYQYYDGSFFGTEPGMHTMKVSIQYDLDSGQRKTVIEEYDVEVMAGDGMYGGGIDMGMGMPGMDGGMYLDESGMIVGGDMAASGNIIDSFLAMDLWLQILIIGGIVILLGGIVTGIILLVRRKRRKDAEFYNE
jgi:hypothetical protein